MTPKRNRTLNAGAGLLTALTVGVATLAGCAPFDPNPAAVPGSNTPAATTPGTPAGTTPGTPGVTPASPGITPVATQKLTINASINGVPLQNAEVTAIDLSTGKTLALVSAGGLNRRLFAASDTKGSVTVNAPAAKAFKIVVRDAKSKQGVSTIVGANAGGFKSIGGAGNTVNCNTDTTIAGNALSGLFEMAAGAGTNSDSLLDQVFSNAGTLATAAGKLDAASKNQVAGGVDASGALANSLLTSITTGNADLKSIMLTSASNILESFAAAKVTGSTTDFSTLGADLAILEALGFNVDISGGTLKITGNGVEIGIEEDETAPPTDAPTDPGTDTELDSDDNNDDEDGLPEDQVSEGFSPGVSITGSLTDGLKLIVTQPQGDQDVDVIVARFNKQVLGAEFDETETELATGTGTGAIFEAGPNFKSDGDFTVTGAASSAAGVALEGSDNAESTVVWNGEWTDGQGAIADVTVYEDEFFLYVAIKNTVSTSRNQSVTVNQHSTTMNVAADVLSFDETKFNAAKGSEAGAVKIYMRSTSDAEAVFFRTL